MENLLIKEKTDLRSLMSEKRKSLCITRRDEAQSLLLNTLISSLPNGMILSYASFQDELDTTELNNWLAMEDRLALPKLNGKTLQIFHVKDLSLLKPHKFGMLEPDPSFCQELNPASLGCILVPGLAFDMDRHRLGYGLGCYDRFLSALNASVPTFGLGFQEQLYTPALPRSPFDFPLSSLLLL